MRRSEDEIRELISVLRKAEKIYDDNFPEMSGSGVEVCVDCKEIIDKSNRDKHSGHRIVWMNCDHNGVHEWIRALKWVLKEADEK